MVSILILNELTDIAIFELRDQQVLLINLSELKSFLNDSAAIFALGKLEHMAKYLVDNCGLLLYTTKLNKFLNHIVAKDIIN